MGCSVAKLFKFQNYIRAGITLMGCAIALSLGGCAGGTEGQNSTPSERSAQFTVESEEDEGLVDILVEIFNTLSGETLAAGTTDLSGKAELKFTTSDKVRLGYMLTRSDREVSVDLGFVDDTSEYEIVHRAVVNENGEIKEFVSQPETVKKKKRPEKSNASDNSDDSQDETPASQSTTLGSSSPTPVITASPSPTKSPNTRPTPVPSNNPGRPEVTPTPEPENDPAPSPTSTPQPETPTPTPSNSQNLESLTEEEFMTLVVDQLIVRLLEEGCDETVFTTSQVRNRVVPSCQTQEIVFSRSDTILATRAKINECVAHVVNVSPYCAS